MKRAKTIQVHHPSGKMYEAWERFVAGCPEPSFFQSPAFVRLIDRSPGAEWVLLLVLSDEVLKDPGANWSGALHDQATAVSKQQQPSAPLACKAEQPVDLGNIMASLLALIVSEEEPQAGLWKTLRGWHKTLTACTLVYNGPLLAPGTRLQQERAIRALLEALNRQVKKRSLCTKIINSIQFNELLPLFNELGYKRQEMPMRQIICLSTEAEPEKQNADRKNKKRVSMENGVLTLYKHGIKQVDRHDKMVNDHTKEINNSESELICFQRKTRSFLCFLTSIAIKPP